MKKIFFCMLAGILTFQLCGCGGAARESVEDGSTLEAGSVGTSAENSSSEGEDLFLSLEDLPWRDNSLDAYSAVLNMPLRYTEPEGAVDGGAWAYILGGARASVFKKHIFQEVSDCWDEIKTVTDQRVETSFRLAFQEGKINQAWMAGSIAGSDHYMMMAPVEKDDDGELLYRFFETDQDMQVLNSFYVDCLDKNDDELVEQLQVDVQGNLHMITYKTSDNTYHYYIVAADGAFLVEGSPQDGFPTDKIIKRPSLFSLYDGRVGIRLNEQLQYVNPETGKAEVLADIAPGCRGCILWDEKTLLYADGKGLYRSGLSGENPELLYTWSNHGVSMSEVLAMQVTENRDIGLIYGDYRGANYLKLTPTTEEVEIQEITFGVPQGANGTYQEVVNAFNKTYPAYRVKVKVYGYYDTTFLTELIAGEGPVLVDTSLTDFERNVKWWEPLDEVLQQMKLEDELIPQAMNMGRINGTLYGIVKDFYLDTLITFAEEPAVWDYDTFLSCFDEEDPSMKSVLIPESGSDGYSFIVKFFYHGLKEKYLFDAENCTTRFDSEEFRKILRLVDYFNEREHQGTSEDVRQGKSLCAQAVIHDPADMACLRIWGGEKLTVIGYPSDEGGKHYIVGSAPIAVRANARLEEKQLAHSFLRFLLSYDAQMKAVMDTVQAGWVNLSVRKDVLEEQINLMNESSYTDTQGLPRFQLGDQVDKELDRAALYSLLEKAEPRQRMPRELSNIFVEELVDYMSGNLTEDRLIEHLENRVGLYLSEQK